MTAVDRPVRIEIIDPFVEGERAAASTGGEPMAVVAVTEAADVDPLRWAAPIARRLGGIAWSWHGRSAQWRLNGNPRRRSTVRRHVAASFADTRAALPATRDPVIVAAGRLDLTSPFRAYDGVGLRARGRLRPRWSWPAMPVEVILEPWWRGHCMLTVQLRTRRRWRYPRRYFDVAHAVLGALVADHRRIARPSAGATPPSARPAVARR